MYSAAPTLYGPAAFRFAAGLLSTEQCRLIFPAWLPASVLGAENVVAKRVTALLNSAVAREVA